MLGNFRAKGLVGLVFGLPGAVGGAFVAYNTWYYHIRDAGPAVVIHSANVSFSHPGESGQVLILLDKIRPCEPQYAIIFFTDATGRFHNAPLDWNTALPVQTGLSVTYSFPVEPSVRPGEVSNIGVQVVHGQCTDGLPDPRSYVKPDKIYANQVPIRANRGRF